jgi:hypothetical protein
VINRRRGLDLVFFCQPRSRAEVWQTQEAYLQELTPALDEMRRIGEVMVVATAEQNDQLTDLYVGRDRSAGQPA